MKGLTLGSCSTYTYLTSADVHANLYPHRNTRGVSVDGTSPQSFLICCGISKLFCLQWKAFDLSQQDEVYFMGDGAAGALWRQQQWSPPRIQIKTGVFCAWYVKQHINKNFESLHPQVLLLLLKEFEKNMHFHSKMAWPPATYDVTSRDHSNWPSLNLS